MDKSENERPKQLSFDDVRQLRNTHEGLWFKVAGTHTTSPKLYRWLRDRKEKEDER